LHVSVMNRARVCMGGFDQQCAAGPRGDKCRIMGGRRSANVHGCSTRICHHELGIRARPNERPRSACAGHIVGRNLHPNTDHLSAIRRPFRLTSRCSVKGVQRPIRMLSGHTFLSMVSNRRTGTWSSATGCAMNCSNNYRPAGRCHSPTTSAGISRNRVSTGSNGKARTSNLPN
jgi:hypothetical protein